MEILPFEKTQKSFVFCSFYRIFAPIKESKDMDISRDILQFLHYHSIDYKKAMLIFYEQNNLYAFKQIFIDQFDFAVREYS